ncbi:hypothetical protein LPJ61_005690, partial [Coemansia biformis]
CQFKKLMEADIDYFYEEDLLLLPMGLTMLVRLVLTNIPPLLLWAGFDPDSGPQIIELPALRYLLLSYPEDAFAASATQIEQSWTLHLPQLQALDITCESE